MDENPISHLKYHRYEMFSHHMTMQRASAILFALLFIGCTGSTPPAKHAEQRTRARTPADIEKGYRAVLASTDIAGQRVGELAGKEVTALVVFASWCSPCRAELAILDEIRQEEPRLRVIGINYTKYEEYAGLSNDSALRTFLAESAPWLQVVRADDTLMDGLGHPRKVPSLLIFNRRGQLVKTYLRARRRPPTKQELKAGILASIPAQVPPNEHP